MATVEAKMLSRLAWPAYALSFLFCFTPLWEWAAVLNWRFDVGTVAWRTGAVGLLSSSLVTPIFGLFLALLVSLVLSHRLTMRVVAVLAGLGALALLGIFASFLLDLIQMRASVADALQRSFLIAGAKAIVNLLIGAVVLSILCVSGLVAARQPVGVRQARGGRAADDALLVSTSR